VSYALQKTVLLFEDCAHQRLSYWLTMQMFLWVKGIN
jgi:hypothetical protein